MSVTESYKLEDVSGLDYEVQAETVLEDANQYLSWKDLRNEIAETVRIDVEYADNGIDEVELTDSLYERIDDGINQVLEKGKVGEIEITRRIDKDRAEELYGVFEDQPKDDLEFI